MSVRGKVWSIGLVASLALVVWLSRGGTTRDLSLPVALLAIAVCAMIAEASALWSSGRGRNDPSIPEGARPADGVVDLVSVSGVEGIPSSIKTEFRRFVGLPGENSPASPVVHFLAICPPLLGKVALVSVFVGRDGVSWSDSEIAAGHEALERSGLWIEREASRHGAPVNLVLADVYFQFADEDSDPVEVAFQPEANDVGPMEVNALTKAIVLASRAASNLGFADVVDWMGQINGRIDADSVVWLFHLRERGRSMAIPAELSAIPGVGFAVCYAREANFPEPLAGLARVDPTTVAHELLHLFGASDKYGASLRTFPEGSVSSREIMRLNHDSLFRMTVDPLTAAEIGWKSAVDSGVAKKNARRRPF
jgi:hypothetical protein